MFKSDPDLMPKYPFYKDEWNKITYQDYQGNHPDQAPHTWFVVFRWVNALSLLYAHRLLNAPPLVNDPIPLNARRPSSHLVTPPSLGQHFTLVIFIFTIFRSLCCYWCL